MARNPFDGRSIEQILQEVPVRRWLSTAGFTFIALVILIAMFTCFYTVEPEGKAVVKRFGHVVAVRDPGLHFKLPFWVDKSYFVPTERVLKEEFGFRTVKAGKNRSCSPAT